MPPVSRDDPKPPYVQIAESLRLRIASGELRPGERLKSGRELAREYGVAPMTIQKAIDALRDEFLVESWPGRGVFVAKEVPTMEQLHGEIERKVFDSLFHQVQKMHRDVEELKERVAQLERRGRKA